MPEETITTLSPDVRALVGLVWVAVFLCALLFSVAVLSGERVALIPLATLPALATVAMRAGRMGISLTRDALVIRNPLWTHRVPVARVVDFGLSDESPRTIFVNTDRRIVFSLLPASTDDLERVKAAINGVRVG